MDKSIVEKNETTNWNSLIKNLKDYLKIKKEIDDIEDVYNQESNKALSNPILYDKELSLITEIKEYKNNFSIDKYIKFLNNEELVELEQLINKSNAVSFEDKINTTYKKMLFIPIVLWNDKENQEYFEKNEEDSVLYKFKDRVNSYLIERLKDNMKNIGLVKVDVGIGFLKVFDFNKSVMYTNNGYNLSDLKSLPLEVLTDLFIIEDSSWLQSGLLPVEISSSEYEAIADLNLDNDGLFDTYFQKGSNDRTIFSNALYLIDAISKVEEIRFELWANTILSHPLTAKAIYRESTLVVTLNKNNQPLSINATIEDVGEDENHVLFEWSGSRFLYDKMALTQSLLPWITNTNTCSIWNVIYELKEDGTSELLIDENEFNDKIIIPDNMTLH